MNKVDSIKEKFKQALQSTYRVISNEYKSNIDIGCKAKLRFEDEVKKYSYMWREGGEYSKK